MPPITQVITTLPAVPDPATDTRDQFSTKAAAYVLAQKAMVPELNTWTEEVNAIVEGAAGDIASGINGAAAKTTPVDADLMTLTDSAASFTLKKLTWANLKTVLGGTFASLAGSASQAFSMVTAAANTNTTQGATTAYADRLTAGTLAGAFTTLSASGDLIAATSAGWTMRQSTSDASDTKGIFIAGGGAVSSSRGAYIAVYGNEYAGEPGNLSLTAGATGSVAMSAPSGGTVGGTVASSSFSLSSTGLTVTGNNSCSGFLTAGNSSGVGKIETYISSATIPAINARQDGAGNIQEWGTSGGALRAACAVTGNFTNLNNSYGAISDIKLKENITDCTPKLAALNLVRIVNYNLKTDPNVRQLGVIAQELEQVFPGMVEETSDFDRVSKVRIIDVPAIVDADGHEITPASTTEEAYVESVFTGTKTKSVKYSVFVPMLIKAVQELSIKNASLEARLAALEAK